jgi:hypothetical protein
MTDTQPRPRTIPGRPAAPAGAGPDRPTVALWQVNVLRLGYLVVGGGLAVFKWPTYFDHEPWSLAEGTVQTMLVAMSFLALLGLRYPLQMLPILLFEALWKLLWLGAVALPLWLDGDLDGAARTQVGLLLWVVIVLLVIPWRYVATHYVLAPGQPWRRTR